MKTPGMLIRHAKARGEWAELRFMTRATELAFRVAKPWGDCAPYDVATEVRFEISAAKRRKNAAHGASRGFRLKNRTKPRRGERKVWQARLNSAARKRIRYC
jgi:hypothetical protein